MATCKDCIHYEVCKTEKGSTVFYREGLLELTYNQVDKLCGALFKDKSRFVELPYKLGDVVFIIFERQVVGCVVRRISFDNTKSGANITLDSLDDNNYGTIYGLLADDDCEIFLTREEAEQALKEHKEL